MATTSIKHREKSRAKKREEILKASVGIFSELGFERATVSDILRTTKLTSSTFYNYFADKEAVLASIIAESTAPLLRGFSTCREEAVDLEEFLKGFCSRYFRFLATDRPVRQLMERNAPIIRSLVNEAVQRTAMEPLEADVRAAIERGQIPPIDAGYLAGAILGATFEMGVRFLERRGADAEAAAGFATGLIIGGLDRVSAEVDDSIGAVGYGQQVPLSG